MKIDKKKIYDILYKYTGNDRRVKFTSLKVDERDESSDVVQFYSSYDNIGNYLPILGIHKMIDKSPDLCCAHRKNIDFEYINREYKCAIIGGAGLLHRSFNHFWSKVQNKCDIPIIVWGVGACLPDDISEVANKKIVNSVFQKAELINVRDSFTASLYDSDKICTSVCPTAAYLREYHMQELNKKNVLVSWHKDLLSKKDNRKITKKARKVFGKSPLVTDNIQTPSEGLEDIIEKYYTNSELVVSSRLHGIIIAYSLKIPYIAIAKDDKIRSFVEDYGNGILVESINELNRHAKKDIPSKSKLSISPELDKVLKFGERANYVINHI